MNQEEKKLQRKVMSWLTNNLATDYVTKNSGGLFYQRIGVDKYVPYAMAKKGVPDIQVMPTNGLIPFFIEVKSSKGRLRPSQEAFFWKMALKYPIIVISPSNWDLWLKTFQTYKKKGYDAKWFANELWTATNEIRAKLSRKLTAKRMATSKQEQNVQLKIAT